MKHLTPLTRAGVALALFLGAAPLTTARADDPKPDDGAAVAAADVAESKTIQWVDGWEAGKAVAEKSGKLMLVYVHRTSPP